MRVELTPASTDDGSALADLRVLAMRESLERVGRFDPQRARDRFLASFAAECTRHIELAGTRVGFVVLTTGQDALVLDHLYIHPERQGEGIGTKVLAIVFAEADACALPLRVGALRESGSNRFYLRHGFVLVREAEWDNYYVRLPKELR